MTVLGGDFDTVDCHNGMRVIAECNNGKRKRL